MAKKATHFPEINLIPKDPFYDTAFGKVMTWTLKVGRYIVVFTEIIVIMSFASRFKLDRDLTDVNSKIVQKTALAQSYGDTEAHIRSIQKKSDTIGKILVQNNSLRALDTLIKAVPIDVKVTRVGYEPTQPHVNGIAKSSQNFAAFLTQVQKEPSFKSVSVNQIVTGDKRDPGVSFSLRISLVDDTIPVGTKKRSTAPEEKL